jgi:hypothetical protein
LISKKPHIKTTATTMKVHSVTTTAAAALLIMTTCCCCCSAVGENNGDETFDEVLRHFRKRNQLLDSANFTLQSDIDFAASFTLGSDEISLDWDDIELVDLLADGARIEVDGVVMTPLSVVYKSKKNQDVRITMDIRTGKFLSATAQHRDGKSHSIVSLGGNNTSTYATFSSDDFDNVALEEFKLEDAVPPPPHLRQRHRNLRSSAARATAGSVSTRPVIRELQSSCSSYDVMEISIVAESTLCDRIGGAAALESLIQSVVADASSYYEVQGVCAKLKLLNTYIFCNHSNDPIRPMLDNAGNSNICNNRNSLLEGFAEYVRTKKIPGDIVHLFHGKDFTGTSTIGCAWTGTFCDGNGYNTAVNELTFSTSPSRLALLLAHENGHILNAYHVQDMDDIMYESLSGGTIFGQQSGSAIRAKLDSTTCADTRTQPRDPEPIPAPVPVPVPVPFPVPVPAPQPVVPPGTTSHIFRSDFRSSTDGFVYADDTFRDTNEPEYAQGGYNLNAAPQDQALFVFLGGVDSRNVVGLSGGWSRSFTLDSPSNVQIVLAYNLEQTSAYEENEYSEVLCTVDGNFVGRNNRNFVTRMWGGGPADLIQETVSIQTGLLPAGPHELIIGGFSNRKTKFDEQTRVRIYSVELSAVGHNLHEPPPPPIMNCWDSDEFRFVANDVVVGCDWLWEHLAHEQAGCAYDVIATHCPDACQVCP